MELSVRAKRIFGPRDSPRDEVHQLGFLGIARRIVKLLLHCSIVYSDISIARSVFGNVDHVDADPCFGRTGTTVGARLA